MSTPQLVGGQAVLEGVMMRCGSRMAIACRRGDNTIGLHQEQLFPLAQRYPFLGWPFIRGAVSFLESLILGVRALNISASEALSEEGEELKGWHTFLMVFLGLALGVGLFFILPTFLVHFLPPLPAVVRNLIEGFIRLTIFIVYMVLITRWGDVQRVFQYHGAEHKVIFCHEDQNSLQVDAIKGYSTRHPRCGTSFILIVMVISILLFSLFGWPSPWLRIVIRLALLPVIAGIAYEAIRLTSKSRSPLVRLIAVPGLWLQRLTTIEPDEGQIEVAVQALRAVLDEFPDSGSEDNRASAGVTANA
jgi:uncharacterized protein YqhQ